MNVKNFYFRRIFAADEDWDLDRVPKEIRKFCFEKELKKWKFLEMKEKNSSFLEENFPFVLLPIEMRKLRNLFW